MARNIMRASLQLSAAQRNIGRAMRGNFNDFLLLACFLMPLSLSAEESNPPNDSQKWGFSVGAFLTDQDLKTQFEVNISGIDLTVDFEDDLGLRDSQSVFRFTAFYDFNERHRLDLDVFDLSQSAVATLSREIEWGDTVFPVSTEVSTGLDLNIYKAAYTYHLLRSEKYRLGVTGGLYVADIALKMRARADDIEEVGAVTAPLPVLGLRGEYFISDRWRASASAEWFGFAIDEYTGTLHDFLVGIDFQFSDHAAIGLGYNSVQIDVDATDGGLRADLIWEYSGVIGYLRFSF